MGASPGASPGALPEPVRSSPGPSRSPPGPPPDPRRNTPEKQNDTQSAHGAFPRVLPNPSGTLPGGLNYQTYLFIVRPPYLITTFTNLLSGTLPGGLNYKIYIFISPHLITTFTNLLSAGLSRIILSPSRPAGCAERVAISK